MSKSVEELGWIVYNLDRIFNKLWEYSPGSKLKPKNTDTYILKWLIVGAALVILRNLPWVSYAIYIVAGLRILDIIQAAIYIVIFNPARENQHTVQDIRRSLILLVVNYVELIFFFGLLYVNLPFKDVAPLLLPPHDAFYFSAISQLTVGYGDIMPCGVTKLIAVVQAFIGWGFSVLILASFVSALPKLVEESKHGNDRV